MTSAPPSWNDPAKSSVGPAVSAPVSDVYVPVCTNEVLPLLLLVSVAKRNRPLTMLSFTVQSIDVPVERMARRFWMTRQSNGCSTPAPRSSAAWQWITRTGSNNENVFGINVYVRVNMPSYIRLLVICLLHFILNQQVRFLATLCFSRIHQFCVNISF